ncbi:hypothetical protein [Streptomyces kronopolitis]|uniref:hypothetical protein n=1 Tax=Streptomyces kronopolitis TaxID=1612435 RepID=UPI0020C0A9A4|nr:hypothetical protein [Streptomyces kronopolitis]MCL6300275.1 hypothetical protein [Streptomyces kronopolitis]
MTTDSLNVAQVMARELGGDVRAVEESRYGRWEVLTESPAVEVVVTQTGGGTVSFTLPMEPDIGAFSFSSNMWNREQISRLSTVGDSYSARCELRLRPVEFKTQTGLTVLYILPSIEMVNSGV